MGKNIRRIVYISSALAPDEKSLVGLDYFTIISVQLAQRFYKKKYDFMFMVPYSNLADDEQLEMVENVTKRKDEFTGIIISPIKTTTLAEYIANWKKKNNKYPIVTIDKGFGENYKEFKEKHKDYEHVKLDEDYGQNYEIFKAKGVVPPPYVMCNGEEGGEEAAKGLHAFFVKKKIEFPPQVIVMRGLEGSIERIIGFDKKMRELTDNNVHIDITDPIPFRREEARIEAEHILNQRLPNNLDAFFCCNDEMALGVKDAIDEFCRTHKNVFKDREKVKIIGFDGISDVTTLIKAGDPWILNTVDVHIRQQVKDLSDLMLELVRKDPNRDKIKKICGMKKCDLRIK